MSPRRNWDSLCPSPQNRGRGWGGHTRLRVTGWGSHNSDDWRKSLALCLLCARESLKQPLIYLGVFWDCVLKLLCSLRKVSSKRLLSIMSLTTKYSSIVSKFWSSDAIVLILKCVKKISRYNRKTIIGGSDRRNLPGYHWCCSFSTWVSLKL